MPSPVAPTSVTSPGIQGWGILGPGAPLSSPLVSWDTHRLGCPLTSSFPPARNSLPKGKPRAGGPWVGSQQLGSPRLPAHCFLSPAPPPAHSPRAEGLSGSPVCAQAGGRSSYARCHRAALSCFPPISDGTRSTSCHTLPTADPAAPRVAPGPISPAPPVFTGCPNSPRTPREHPTPSSPALRPKASPPSQRPEASLAPHPKAWPPSSPS